MPLTVLILFGLFAVQSHGTARVAAFFGPITLVWFIALALGGIAHIAQNPGVLAALNPVHGMMFLASHGWIGLATLGAVFLAVTGCEALYADLGHFGRGPIQTAWLLVALPALTLNYFGQGALLLASPEAIENPFFLLYPEWALLPMVGLATAATVIASQAVITGAFSLTHQAVQLGLLPRLHIQRTSETQAGQIYIPRINGILLVGVLLLVAQFRSSSALASAYGIAVSGTMVVTALLALVVIWKSWKWPLWAAAALIVPFLLIDTTFLAANMLKVFHGGWVPLLIGGFVILIMLTWRRGAKILAAKTRRLETPIEVLIKSLEKRPPPRVPGTAVFLTATPDSAPTALLAQPQALQGAARPTTSSSPSSPRTCRGSRPRTACRSSRSATASCARCSASASWKRRTCRRRSPLRGNTAGPSTSCPRRSSCRDARCAPTRARGMPLWQDRLFIFLAAERRRCVELFPAAHGPRGRDRHASHGVAVTASMAAAASGNQSQSDMKRRSQVICRLA